MGSHRPDRARISNDSCITDSSDQQVSVCSNTAQDGKDHGSRLEGPVRANRLTVLRLSVTEFTRVVSAMAIMHHGDYCFTNNEVRTSAVDTRTAGAVTWYSHLYGE